MIVLFEDGNNLQVHDPVFYKSVQIGEITAVNVEPNAETGKNDFSVNVQMQQDYLKMLHADMHFVAQPESFNSMRIVIKDNGSVRYASLRSHDKVRGKSYGVYLREEALNLLGVLKSSL